jgi:hypothetical protein
MKLRSIITWNPRSSGELWLEQSFDTKSGSNETWSADEGGTMRWNSKFALVALAGMTCSMVGPQLALSQTLPTHRIPAALALEAVGEAVAACAK